MIPVASPVIDEDELANVTEAVKSSWISSRGKFIPEFEGQFSKFCGAKHGVATSNGTTALHLALKALGIGKDDEVIVPTLTFIATANTVSYCNAKPVFVDSHPDYWCIDPAKIEEKITKQTKAIIPVHLYGHPCDMKPVLDIAKDHNLYVIEDAAEAHGAEYQGKKVGSFGDINCFSFYGNKIITTGEGGMCITNNEELDLRMRILRDHGQNLEVPYWHDVIGFNYRLTNLQAAIGVAQMKKLENIIEKKRQLAQKYNAALSGNDDIICPSEMPWAKNVYWMYSILLADKFNVNRDGLLENFKRAGIETRPLFYPTHIMPPHKTEENFPVAEKLSKRGLNLPSGINLTEDDIVKIVDVIYAAGNKV